MKLAAFPLFLISLIAVVVFLPLSNAGQSEYTCDTCHTHANVYKSHLSFWNTCWSCHGEVHATHESVDCISCHEVNPFTILCHSAPSDSKIPISGINAACANCHAIVTDHGGDCVTCHTEDVNEIHSSANVFGR